MHADAVNFVAELWACGAPVDTAPVFDGAFVGELFVGELEPLEPLAEVLFVDG